MSEAESVVETTVTVSKKSDYSPLPFNLNKSSSYHDCQDYEEGANGGAESTQGGQDGAKLLPDPDPDVVDLVSSDEEDEEAQSTGGSSPPAYDENSNSNSNSNATTTANNTNTNGAGNVVTTNGHKEPPSLSQPTNGEASTSRIGPQYQAETVRLVENLTDRSRVQTKEDLVWAPSDKLSSQEFDAYLHHACYKHSYNIEQALSVLFWHKFDLKKAYHDLNVYVPTPVIWTREEQILFEHAFTFHGKNFSKIRQVLPDKKQSDLVNYYYMWKKSRGHMSLIDYQQMNKANNGGGGGGGGDSLDNSLDEDGEDGEENFENMTKICLNCDLITNDLQSTPKGMLCNPCYNYWKHTGLMKPDHLTNFTIPSDDLNSQQTVSSTTNGGNETKPAQTTQNGGNHLATNGGIEAKPSSSSGSGSAIDANGATKVNSQKIFHKSLRKLPKGIYLNCEELLSLVKTDNDRMFDSLSVKLRAKKEEVQRNKQLITDLLLKLTQDNRLEIALDDELLELEESWEPTPYWTSNEIELVLQGLSRYGENFKAISEVIGTKTEASIKAFYEYNKDFLNLDKFISPSNAKDLKAKATSVIDNMSKANAPNAPKMLTAEISSSSSNVVVVDHHHDVSESGETSRSTAAKMDDPKDHEDVIVIDEEENTGSSSSGDKKEQAQVPAASEPTKAATTAYAPSIDENEDVIFFSNDSN